MTKLKFAHLLSPISPTIRSRARAALVNITDEELNAKVKRQRGQSRHGQQRGQLSDEEEERKTPDEKLLCTLAQVNEISRLLNTLPCYLIE